MGLEHGLLISELLRGTDANVEINTQCAYALIKIKELTHKISTKRQKPEKINNNYIE